MITSIRVLVIKRKTYFFHFYNFKIHSNNNNNNNDKTPYHDGNISRYSVTINNVQNIYLPKGIAIIPGANT